MSTSWFSEIAGKAEALLDRMDQVAATSIQSAGIATPLSQNRQGTGETSLTYEPTASVGSEKTLRVPSQPSNSSPALHKTRAPYSPVSRPEAPPQATPPPSSHNAFSKSRSRVPNDESIFEFLNTPTREVSRKPHALNRRTLNKSSSQAAGKVDSQPCVDTSTRPLSGEKEKKGSNGEGEGQGGVKCEAKASVGGGGGEGHGQGSEGTQLSDDTDSGGGVTVHNIPVQSSAVRHSGERPQDTLTSAELPPDTLTSAELPPDTLTSAELHVPQEAVEPVRQPQDRGMTASNTHSVVQHQPTLGGKGEVEKDVPSEQQLVNMQQKVSGLELENKLLKREMSSLNDELGTVLERVREAEECMALHRTEAESLREQTAASERVIRQLRSHDEDIQAALEARDSQIQVLRKELQESEQREAIMKERLNGQGREKERLLQDASLSNEASNHALEVLKTQLQQTEEQLTQEREAGIRAKMEFAERESVLQNEQRQLSDSVAAQRRQLGLLQSKVSDSQRAVQSANRELVQVNREHEDYKKRAAGILQAKEKLITSLQAGGDNTSGPAHEAILEQLRLEKEAVETELEMARLQGAGLREELQEAEEQHSRELELLTEQVRELEGGLVSERALQQSAKEDLQRATVELEAAREVWERERSSLAALVKEREAEITELKTRVPASPLSPHSHTELESRLHELTESLIQKQTTLEALSSEKTSLKLQLERTESQLLSAKRAHPPPSHTAVNGLESNVPTDVHIRPMASVLPNSDSAHSDSRLHNVRRAMNSLDTFSVRLAVFLRRYPYARLFLLFYVALLHIWVLVVLLTYTPEVHDLDDLAAEP